MSYHQYVVESGYGALLRTVASTLDESDPGAAQALSRAADEVEEMVVALRLCRPVVERYGRVWTKDTDYYAAAEALGINETFLPPSKEPS